MRLVMLGGPGSGKATQSQRLSQHFNVPIIVTGNMLRKAIEDKTELGQKAKDYVEKGDLLPNEIMIELMRNRLVESDVKNGWILSGYPRTAFQAEELDFLLESLNQSLDYAIYLQVSETVMKQRSLKRGLMDDQPDIIDRRINMFKEYTLTLIDYYQGKQKLLTLSGETSVNQVEQEILTRIL
ncbi:MAG: nucleoside monophosphate kinase [Crocosphaera sp.]|nr:nucleoside monophosphate kinase [Crocosphaera sp.]